MSSSNRELALAYLKDAEYAFEEAMMLHPKRQQNAKTKEIYTHVAMED